MPLAERTGIDEATIARIDLLQGSRLPPAETLLQAAFDRGPSDPGAANALLASALLAQAQATSEGRLAASLSLLAKLVGAADPARTLGPAGAAIREEIMPNGWRYTLASWPRFRYAWREGMRDLLRIETPDQRALADAIDEVTRLTPAEPEPVSVAIQETWPRPSIAFAFSLLGIAVSGGALYVNWTQSQRRRRR